jgi:NTP pyrophosphatase (non-canonical NTP hydrolase)
MEMDSIFQLLSSATEELGELSVAVRHESGYRDKVLKEPAFIEAIDLMICAINMYFATGGKIADLTLIMESKLDKWERLC